jgi:transcriptional regulator with XRE-family HTH domain
MTATTLGYIRPVAIHADVPRVGPLLRSWRERRKLSQLELSLRSEISSRHLSFVETGRSRPSRDMVLHLAEQLEVPLRERNSLLLAAGYAPVYGERPLDADDMTPIRNAVDRFLRAHEPYPALVADGHWNLVAVNDAMQVITDGVAPELLEPPANGLRICLHPDGMAPRIANFGDWSTHILHRLRSRAQSTGDAELERLYDELAAYPGVEPHGRHGDGEGAGILVPLQLRHGDVELDFVSTVATFVTAEDITLAELAIEAFYPANASTAAALMTRAAAVTPTR